MKKKWKMLPLFLMLLILCFEMEPVRAEVTGYTRYFQKDKELNKYIFSWHFEIDGGKKYAFCIERSKNIPEIGDENSEWSELFNEDIRKVLYYGYGGPEDQGYTVVETSCAAAAANGDNDTFIGENILAEIQQLDSPPDNYRCWMIETNGGKTQNLAFLTSLLTGELMIEKSSTQPAFTEDNPEYSLKGAVYGVYSDEECENQIAEMVTDEEGCSETITLDEGTYYVKELQAPPGYELDETVFSVEVLVERTAVLETSDEPIAEFVLPNTGSAGMAFWGLAGTGSILISINRKKETI